MKQKVRYQCIIVSNEYTSRKICCRSYPSLDVVTLFHFISEFDWTQLILTEEIIIDFFDSTINRNNCPSFSTGIFGFMGINEFVLHEIMIATIFYTNKIYDRKQYAQPKSPDNKFADFNYSYLKTNFDVFLYFLENLETTL